jgi:hypothetical protein
MGWLPPAIGRTQLVVVFSRYSGNSCVGYTSCKKLLSPLFFGQSEFSLVTNELLTGALNASGKCDSEPGL